MHLLYFGFKLFVERDFALEFETYLLFRDHFALPSVGTFDLTGLYTCDKPFLQKRTGDQFCIFSAVGRGDDDAVIRGVGLRESCIRCFHEPPFR